MAQKNRFLLAQSIGRLAVVGVLALAMLVGGGACLNLDQPSTAQVTGVGQNVLELLSMQFGRLVDILDVTGVVIDTDVLVRAGVQTDGINYLLSINPVTEAETLQILQPAGSQGFADLLAAAQSALGTISTRGPLQPPPFDMLPRNAALKLTFSELVDEDTVDNNTIQLLVGDPPTVRQSVRFIVQNDPVARRGCVIIDPTISARQSATLGIPQNAVGFPASFDSVNDNILLRIPTEVEGNFGQPEVLRNQARTRTLSVSPIDPTQSSLGGKPVVVRAFRSGNSADLSNGFLEDLRRPNLVTQMATSVAEVTLIGALREVRYSINATNCMDLLPKVGDVHEVGAGILLVSAVVSSGNPASYRVRGSVIEGDIPAGDFSGSPIIARLTTRYTGQDATLQGCYIAANPPLDVADLPLTNIDPNASITVRFDEPIDGGTVLSMHSFVITEMDLAAPTEDNSAPYQADGPESVPTYIDRLYGYMADGSGGNILFGPVEVGNGNRSFTLTPAAGWANPGGGAFDLAVALRDGQDGIRDLAGNPVTFSSFVAGTPGQDASTFITIGGGGPLDNRYFALRALSVDENNDGLTEYDGQFEVGQGTLKGRGLERFSRLADSSNQFVNAGITVASNTTPFEPLTPAGSVMMTVYRPHDMGFGFVADSEFNLDVEGWNWAPTGGLVFDDTFERFSLALSHSNRMPDEVINPQSGLPVFPLTGLRTGGETFDDNILGFPEFDEEVVFDGAYTIRSINLFSAASLVSMLPMPSFLSTYTWRDTAISQEITGAPNGAGSPPVAHSFPPIWATPPYGGVSDNPAPSIGLPLQARFRAYPLGQFLGINRFQVSRLVALSALPAFRVFSSGGQDGGGIWQLVIPDNDLAGGTRPNGGFTNTGTPTRNHDPYIYWTQVDFVIRVSRVYTHWFNLGGSLSSLEGINIEPDLVNQPPGTEIALEFRGSVDVQDPMGNDPGPLTDANVPFDDYGDFVGVVGSVAQPSDWTENFSDLAGTNQYFQIRITFVSNIQQNLEPFLDALGIAYDTN